MSENHGTLRRTLARSGAFFVRLFVVFKQDIGVFVFNAIKYVDSNVHDAFVELMGHYGRE